jgi:hypothetical protein
VPARAGGVGRIAFAAIENGYFSGHPQALTASRFALSDLKQRLDRR